MKKDYIVLSAIVLLLIAGIVLFLWDYGYLQKDALDEQQSESTSESTSEENQSQTIYNDDEQATDQAISMIDETWNLYRSSVNNFSIKIPKELYIHNAECSWNNQRQSYYSESGSVPTKFFEKEGVAYLKEAYFYELIGQTEEIIGYHQIGDTEYPDTTYRWSGCRKVINSISLIEQEERQTWQFVFKDVKDDNELESFMKERYGSGCQLGEKIPSKQTGVFDIEIKGDDKEPGESNCFINYITVLKYYPAQQRAVSWDLGQSYGFCADSNCQKAYDGEIVSSFRFEQE